MGWRSYGVAVDQKPSVFRWNRAPHLVDRSGQGSTPLGSAAIAHSFPPRYRRIHQSIWVENCSACCRAPLERRALLTIIAEIAIVRPSLEATAVSASWHGAI